MQNLRLIFLAPMALTGLLALGQPKGNSPTSLDPGLGHFQNPRNENERSGRHRVLSGKRSRIRKSPVRHTAQYEFYERVERAAKLRQKMLIEQSRYKRTDFGHRKKLRKRPPHKMRHCSECGIRH